MNETVVAKLVKDYVKEYLQKNGKKQEFLAREIGYQPKRFSQIINGRCVMKIDDLVKICTYFNVPASTFIPIESQAS